MASQLPLISQASSWLQTATHTKDILPSIQTALILQCSELRTLYLHQPCETTPTLTDIQSSQHLHGASHLDSAEYTLVLEVICQKVLYGGHTGGCAPPLLLPGHVGQQETLLITRLVGICRQKTWFFPCWPFCRLLVQTQESGSTFPRTNFRLHKMRIKTPSLHFSESCEYKTPYNAHYYYTK